jgi:hypothetical protein
LRPERKKESSFSEEKEAKRLLFLRWLNEWFNPCAYRCGSARK